MKQSFASMRLFAIILFSGIILSSCDKNDDNTNPPAPVGPDVNFYALTDNNSLLYCNGKTVSTPMKTITVTGLPGSDKLLGIDFRPNTGQLFGISSGNRIYVINVETGAATAVGSAAFATPLNGTFLGFDFNPTVDRIRVVTNTGRTCDSTLKQELLLPLMVVLHPLQLLRLRIVKVAQAPHPPYSLTLILPITNSTARIHQMRVHLLK